MKIATSFKIIKGKIQLFDSDKNPIPSKGTKWEGWFDCSNNPGLTSLAGAPESVGGWFNCSNNPGLTSLAGAPESVGGWFACSNNLGLTSLAGAPESVGRGFSCSNNPGLTSLAGAPESVGGWFDCSNNPGLTSLAGAPESVGGWFACYNNLGLTSLAGAPESVGGWFNCSNNPGLTSLAGAPESVGRGFSCSNNPGLTSLAGAPKQNCQQFTRFLAKGFVFLDGILTKKISAKIKLDVTIYKTAKIGFKKNAPIVYIAVKGGFSAHGKSVAIAVADLAFKSGERTVDNYRNMPIDTQKTSEDWAIIYHDCTGACWEGIEMFMSGKELKKKYTLKQILAETNGAYGYEEFKSVVAA